jgi:cytochrome c oxidase subunit 1
MSAEAVTNVQPQEHEHEHRENFITKYIFSTDHKMIAKQYLITALVMALIGGVLSSIFRLQLGYPDQSFPWLENILGKWAEGGSIDPNFYLAMVTMHGTIMIFFVLTGGLSGTFSNLLIPLQIGARDMASPFMNMLSYWLFFVSSAVMVSSLFISTGPAAGGWTIYPPLSALPEAMPGSGLGMTLWLISMAIFIAAIAMGGLNYISTVLNMRTKGMTMTRLPLTIWALLLTAVLGLLTFPVLLAAAVLLISDRSLGTSFYLSNIFVGGEPLVNQTGGSPLLWQHLFWFLGHPEVYIVLLPALGIVSEVLATQSRKPIFGYRAMILSLFGITILSFLVWGHHMFTTGMNPFLGSVFLFTTLLIAIPSAVKVFNYLATLWKGKLNFSPAMLWSVGFVSVFITGGLTGLFLGNNTLDIQLHNTYFVVAHFHIVMGSASIFGMFAGVYHWFPKMFGRHLNAKLGYLHFWLTFIAVYLTFFPMHFMGVDGVPRRYYSFTSFNTFDEWVDLNSFITIAAIAGFFAQGFFVYNFFKSMFRGEVSSRNPWGANTLEWTTEDVLPGHGNWKGAIPVVNRWPYDYSHPEVEADFLPQTISAEDFEKGVDFTREDYSPLDHQTGIGGGEPEESTPETETTEESR